MQYHKRYSELKKYYDKCFIEQENRNNQAQNTMLFNNTQCFLNCLQSMTILQHNALQKQKSEKMKEAYRLAWSKYQARRKYRRRLRRLEWEVQENEEEELKQAKNMLKRD